MKNVKKHNETHEFLEALYIRYRGLLLSVIKKYVGQSHICEDLFHEVFIRIMHHTEKLSVMPQPQMEAYICMIARGVSIDYLRKETKIDVVDVSDENFQNHNRNIWGASHDIFDRVDISLMLQRLAGEERELLIGRYYLGLSIKDLSKRFGGSEVTIRSRIHRAKKKLLDSWTKSGLRMEDFIS